MLVLMLHVTFQHQNDKKLHMAKLRLSLLPTDDAMHQFWQQCELWKCQYFDFWRLAVSLRGIS